MLGLCEFTVLVPVLRTYRRKVCRSERCSERETKGRRGSACRSTGIWVKVMDGSGSQGGS